MSAIACPAWRVPDNLSELIASDEDSAWEMPGWSPLRVLPIAGTVYTGRPTPLAWQLEFDPFDDAYASANARLFDPDDGADGTAWAELLASAVAQSAPTLGEQLNVDDAESSDCVIWTESEDACRLMSETAWKLVFGDDHG